MKSKTMSSLLTLADVLDTLSFHPETIKLPMAPKALKRDRLRYSESTMEAVFSLILSIKEKKA